MFYSKVTAATLNSAHHHLRSQELVRSQFSKFPLITATYHLLPQQQRKLYRHFTSMLIITKLRLFDRDVEFPNTSFFRKKSCTDYHPWKPSTPTRSIGGKRGVFGGSDHRPNNSNGGVGSNTFASSYNRHTDEPTTGNDDPQDETQNDAKQSRDFHDTVRDRSISTDPVNLERSDTTRKVPENEKSRPEDHGYSLHRKAGPSITPLNVDLMHQLITDRIQCRLNRDFARADAIQQQLMDAHVQLDDRNQLWRSDGIRFVPDGHDYTYAPDAGPCRSSMPEEEILELIRERYACKISHNFTAADIIETELKDVGVDLNDEERLWRADGETFSLGHQKDDGNGVVDGRGRGSYNRGGGGNQDASGTKPNVVGPVYNRHPDDRSDDIDVEGIDRLIQKRHVARRKRNYDYADSIRSELRSVYGVIVNDRDRTWHAFSKNVHSSGANSNPPMVNYGPTGHNYVLYKQAGASVSSLKMDSIHELIADRLQCKIHRDYNRADAIRKLLMTAHVHLDDRNQLWRADGICFTPDAFDYAYALNAGPNISSMPEEEIKQLLEERYEAKKSGEFLLANSIQNDLEDAGVYINDDELLWRADGKRF